MKKAENITRRFGWIRGFRAAAVAACLIPVIVVGCKLIMEDILGNELLSDFPHAVHIENELACDDCHQPSEGGGPPTLPTREDCSFCHEEETEGDLLDRYFGEDAAQWVHAGSQSDEIVFDHGSHERHAEGDCDACHDDVSSASGIGTGVKFFMDECVDCHEDKGAAQDECALCHSEIGLGSRPASHGGSWDLRHGLTVRHGSFRTQDRCELCHAEDSCNECHLSERPRSHNQYWRGRGHGLTAGIDRSRCSVCHQQDSCDRCHSRTRPASHRGSFGSPFNRHCVTCHLPLGASESCRICHESAPSHDSAPILPSNVSHTSATQADCRTCHFPPPHADNGQTCRFCHF